MNQLEVGTEFVRNLLELFQSQGGKPAELLASEGVDGNPLQGDTELTLSAETYSRLYAKATSIVGDECFGFFGQNRVPSGTFSILCEYLLPASNLADALQRASRLFNWMQKLQHRSAELKPLVAFSVEADIATLNFINQSTGASSVFISQRAIASSLSSWHSYLSWLVAKPIPLLEVQLQGRCQLDEAIYQRVFGAPLRYQQAANAVVISAEHLQAPIAHTRQSLDKFIRLAPYHLVGARERDSSEHSVCNQVRGALGEDFSQKLPGLDNTAKRLGIKPRALKLGLEKEGRSFQAVKEQARMQASLFRLRNSTLPMADIARTLGFEQLDSFEQSFEAWAGLSPQSYRDHFQSD